MASILVAGLCILGIHGVRRVKSMQPSTRYHTAVRFVIAKYGPAFQLAGADRIKWAAATSLAATHVYRKYPKLSSDEVSAAVIEAAKSALDVEVLPEAISGEVRLLLTGLSLAHTFTDLECCKRCAWLCRPAKPETSNGASAAFETARLDPAIPVEEPLLALVVAPSTPPTAPLPPSPTPQSDDGERISSNV